MLPELEIILDMLDLKEIYRSETYVNYIRQWISKEKAFTDDHQWKLLVFMNKLILKEIKEHNAETYKLASFPINKTDKNLEKPLTTLNGKHLKHLGQSNAIYLLAKLYNIIPGEDYNGLKMPECWTDIRYILRHFNNE